MRTSFATVTLALSSLLLAVGCAAEASSDAVDSTQALASDAKPGFEVTEMELTVRVTESAGSAFFSEVAGGECDLVLGIEQEFKADWLKSEYASPLPETFTLTKLATKSVRLADLSPGDKIGIPFRFYGLPTSSRFRVSGRKKCNWGYDSHEGIDVSIEVPRLTNGTTFSASKTLYDRNDVELEFAAKSRATAAPTYTNCKRGEKVTGRYVIDHRTPEYVTGNDWRMHLRIDGKKVDTYHLELEKDYSLNRRTGSGTLEVCGSASQRIEFNYTEDDLLLNDHWDNRNNTEWRDGIVIGVGQAASPNVRLRNRSESAAFSTLAIRVE